MIKSTFKKKNDIAHQFAFAVTTSIISIIISLLTISVTIIKLFM